MWNIEKPKPVKLIIGILAADQSCLQAGRDSITEQFGAADLISDSWSFTHTDYYKDELGRRPLRQFVSIEKLIDPGELAQVKHKTNRMEQKLAAALETDLPRPVNLDPGIIEPSKLILASTKNFSQRIYIGENMYAELTLMFCRGKWQDFVYTYPDYKQPCYHEFFNRVRRRLLEQPKE